MSLELTYPELALHPRSLAGVRYPHPSLENTYQPGCTESYIAQLAAGLLVASGADTVLETGSFQGTTTAWLALALEQMGGGWLQACDIMDDRFQAVWDRLDSLPIDNVEWHVRHGDVLQLIADLPNDHLGFAWVDDCHEKPHVEKEIQLLWPKMRSGGLLVFHDVFGSVDLQEVVRKYGGYCIDLPRLGPAGGIGVLQVR